MHKILHTYNLESLIINQHALNPVASIWNIIEKDVRTPESIPLNFREMCKIFDKLWVLMESKHLQFLTEFKLKRIVVFIKIKGSVVNY
ncbi:hypothetical protein TNIN_247831 [Trichonephila inaurata madagascariensis]|uniref:Uncharacterized protein n=1 Tax=Trichonephila inaurata madagascariensis TaxID=2747483 RepID=A0A8X7BXR2_9ARAC|nr:hypothetical protein TNIN_247831 [Trichonephila inaurata madagascariensis]